jgi:hypothetical protein
VTLDQPVFLASASDARVNTGSAKIKVALLTNATVIMFIRYGLAAAIAIDIVGSHREIGK